MSMEYFDGFDFCGDNTEGSVLNDLLGRGWIASSGLVVTAQDAEPLWENIDAVFEPWGKSIHLSGTSADYLSHKVKPWLDAAVGFNILFDSIPSGGPHKLVEVGSYIAGVLTPRYTLCINNGKFELFAYGEVGVDAVSEGNPWYTGTLSANRLYCLHYYIRRSARILYIDGVQELQRGGYAGLEEFHYVRFFTPTSYYLDDFYQTFTQPSISPGAYDTLMPYAYYNEETGENIPHKVVTAKPIQEVDKTGEWAGHNGTSVIEGTTGVDSAYIHKVVTGKGDWGVILEDVDWPEELYTYHWQGLLRSNRHGSVQNAGFYIEAQYPGYTPTGLTAGQLAALEAWWHIDTVLTQQAIYIPPRDFRPVVGHCRTTNRNTSYTSTPAHINNLQWFLRDKFQPKIYSQGA